MGEKDLRRLFAPFGEINVVDVQMNSVTGKNQGFAIVKFCAAASATSAIKAMNGYVVNGSPLLVTQLSPYLTMGSRPSQLNDEDKVAPKQFNIIPPAFIVAEHASKYGIATVEETSDPLIKQILRDIKHNRFYSSEPTRVVGLFNLFDFRNPTLAKDKVFLEELVNDVSCFLIS